MHACSPTTLCIVATRPMNSGGSPLVFHIRELRIAAGFRHPCPRRKCFWPNALVRTAAVEIFTKPANGLLISRTWLRIARGPRNARAELCVCLEGGDMWLLVWAFVVCPALHGTNLLMIDTTSMHEQSSSHGLCRCACGKRCITKLPHGATASKVPSRLPEISPCRYHITLVSTVQY